MKLTSGFNFENYEITDYLGFCSGEYALNTKFLSDFNLLSSYSEKLEAAQKKCSRPFNQQRKANGCQCNYRTRYRLYH